MCGCWSNRRWNNCASMTSSWAGSDEVQPAPAPIGEGFTVLYDANGEMIVRGGAREAGIADNPASSRWPMASRG